MLSPERTRFAGLWIFVLSALVFVPFIGNCNLFDWDEVNFAECAREMLVTGEFSRVQIAYHPFWEKPPLFIWMQALSMSLFGVSEFAARFPNALCGILTVFAIFRIGKQLHTSLTGWIWALLFTATLLPHFYFKSGIIDPWFNLFILLALHRCFVFLKADSNNSAIDPLIAGLLLGMAVLTKGPVAILVTALTLLVVLFWTKQISKLWSWKMGVFYLTTLLVSGSWFLIEWLRGNNEVILEFINYQVRLFNTEDSGHSGPWFYHALVLLLGCFPASLLFMIAYRKPQDLTENQKLFRKFMLALFWVVLLLFSIVKTKIIHYSSLCYFPLTFIAAFGISRNFSELNFRVIGSLVYWFLVLLIGIAFVILGFTEQIKEKIILLGLIKDEFAVQCLRAHVTWNGFEFLIGILFMLGSWMIYRAVQTKRIKWFYLGCLLNVLFIFSAVVLIVPKIEAYTQRAAVDFYKLCAKEPCYIETRGFKSYAYLFYSRRMPGDYLNPDQVQFTQSQLDDLEKQSYSRLTSHALANLVWIENGKTDRKAFVVSKSIDDQVVQQNKNLNKLYSKNGYSFFVRMPSDTAK